MRKLSTSARQTFKIGKAIVSKLGPGRIILLSGSLGAGKTVLAKGIAAGLGIDEREVLSPAFVFLRVYKGKRSMNHFDFYRVKNPAEIMAMGYEEYFYSDAVTIIEWPERLKFLLPKEFLKIKLVVKGDSSRLLEFSARGREYERLLKDMYEDIRY